MSQKITKLKEAINKIGKAFANGKDPSMDDLKYMFKNLDMIDDINDADTYDVMDSIWTSPNMQAHASRMFEANEQMLQDQKIQQNLALANTIWDVGLSIGQIGQSKRSLEAIEKPSRARLPRIDTTLQSEIDRTLGDVYSPDFRELDPAAQNIARTYAGELDQSRIASGGQAGAYGAMGQAAALRRQDAGRQLVPMASQLVEQDRNRLQSLLGMRMGQQNVIDQIQEARYAQDLDQYMQEQMAAGQLGSVGRENLARSRGNLVQQLGPLVSDMANRFRGMKVGDEEGDLDYGGYEDMINSNLMRRDIMPRGIGGYEKAIQRTRGNTSFIG